MNGGSRIRKLASETAIYGVSSIFGRPISFLLFPFYSNVFLPDVYEPVIVIYAAFVFLNVLYQHGMESAYLKYAADAETEEKRRKSFSTAIGSLTVTSLLFSGALMLFRDGAGTMLGLDSTHQFLLAYAAGILLIDTLCVVPYAELRLRNQPWRFALIRTSGILVTVGLNLFLILSLDMGIEAIFIANMAASSVTLLLLFPTIISRYRWQFDRQLIREFLHFGLPFVPGGLGYALSERVNIFFLEHLPPEKILALYGHHPAVQRLADSGGAEDPSVYANFIVGAYGGIIKLAVFMALVVQMFRYAWQPFFLQHAKDTDARELFARVFTFLTAGLLIVFLAVSFFADDIVAIPVPGDRTLIAPSYWIGLSVIPIALVGYIFQGWYYAFSAGLYIEKKTRYFVTCTLAGSVVALSANILFVPQYGMVAAAWSTSASYAVMSILLLVFSQRFYHVSYQWGRVGLMVAAASGVFALWYFEPALQVFWIEGLLVAGFVIVAVLASRARKR